MRDEKGQALVLFILFLPLLVLFGAFVVESSQLLYQKNKLDNINSNVLNSLKNEEIVLASDVEKLLKINDEDIIIDDISIGSDIVIEDHVSVKGFFGKLIGLNDYYVKSSKRVSFAIQEIAVLDIDRVSARDNTNHYVIQSKNVVEDKGLLFENANMVIKDFHLNEQYRIEMSFSPQGDGHILDFGGLSLIIREDELLIDQKKLATLVKDKNYSLIIDNGQISLNGQKMGNVVFDSYDGDLVIGNDFKGRVQYLRIYSLRK